MRAQKNKTRISLNPGYACSLNGTLRKHRSRHRQNRPLQVLLHPARAAAAFRRDRKRWRLRQQRCLEVASRPAILVWSTRRVGLIDIKVGNACASAHRNVPPRDAARRTTSLRNARTAGDIPAALVRLARTYDRKLQVLAAVITQVVRRASRPPAEPSSSADRHAKGTVGELARCWSCGSR